MDKGFIVRWRSDPENTKETIFPVFDKHLHKIKENLPLWEELDILQNGALSPDNHNPDPFDWMNNFPTVNHVHL